MVPPFLLVCCNSRQMTADELEKYLHDHIPISKGMGVSVLYAGTDGVVLESPLEPNINHRDTVFGGSASALAILSGWSLMRIRLGANGVDCRIVIRRSEVDFTLPIEGRFRARAALVKGEDWDRFLRSLKRRGKAKIEVGAVLECDNLQVGSFKGTFAALAKE